MRTLLLISIMFLGQASFCQNSYYLKKKLDSIVNVINSDASLNERNFQANSSGHAGRLFHYTTLSDKGAIKKIHRTYVEGQDSVVQLFYIFNTELILAREIHFTAINSQLQVCSRTSYYENKKLKLVEGPDLEGCQLDFESALPDFGVSIKYSEALEHIKKSGG